MNGKSKGQNGNQSSRLINSDDNNKDDDLSSQFQNIRQKYNISDENFSIFKSKLREKSTNNKITISNSFDLFKLSIIFKDKNITAKLIKPISTISKISWEKYDQIEKYILEFDESIQNDEQRELFKEYLTFTKILQKLSEHINEFFHSQYIEKYSNELISEVLNSVDQKQIPQDELIELILKSKKTRSKLLSFIDIHSLSPNKREEFLLSLFNHLQLLLISNEFLLKYFENNAEEESTKFLLKSSKFGNVAASFQLYRNRPDNNEYKEEYEYQKHFDQIIIDLYKKSQQTAPTTNQAILDSNSNESQEIKKTNRVEEPPKPKINKKPNSKFEVDFNVQSETSNKLEPERRIDNQKQNNQVKEKHQPQPKKEEEVKEEKSKPNQTLPKSESASAENKYCDNDDEEEESRKEDEKEASKSSEQTKQAQDQNHKKDAKESSKSLEKTRGQNHKKDEINEESSEQIEQKQDQNHKKDAKEASKSLEKTRGQNHKKDEMNEESSEQIEQKQGQNHKKDEMNEESSEQIEQTQGQNHKKDEMNEESSEQIEQKQDQNHKKDEMNEESSEQIEQTQGQNHKKDAKEASKSSEQTKQTRGQNHKNNEMNEESSEQIEQTQAQNLKIYLHASSNKQETNKKEQSSMDDSDSSYEEGEVKLHQLGKPDRMNDQLNKTKPRISITQYDRPLTVQLPTSSNGLHRAKESVAYAVKRPQSSQAEMKPASKPIRNVDTRHRQVSSSVSKGPTFSAVEIANQKVWKENEEIFKKGKYNVSFISYDIKAKLDASNQHTFTVKKDRSFKQEMSILFKNKHKFGISEKKLILSRIEVTHEGTFEAARRFKSKQIKEVCALNFASATKPGGGVKNGRTAQEETLSRQSSLYLSLITQPEMYEYHKRQRNPFYSDYMIYSPNVVVIRDENNELTQPIRVSVISSAAVNKSEIDKAYGRGVRDLDVYKCMKNRIRKIIELCISTGNRTIILGAFGCGVFGNDPAHISQLFKEVLVDEYYGLFIDHIIFAIKSSRTKPGINYEAFSKTFKKH